MGVVVIALVYLGLCFGLALLGRNRKFGYWGYFFVSLFLTPIVGLIALIGSDKRPKITYKCPKCDHQLV